MLGKGVAIEYNQVQQSRREELICNSRSSIGRKRINEFPYLGSRDRTSSNRDPFADEPILFVGKQSFNSQSISIERRKVMQAGVHLQMLVGAVGMERKMNSSIGLGPRWRHWWVGREYLETTLSKPRGKLDAGLCLAFSSALTPVDVPSPVSMKKN
ncbi:unnamed protein product [Sphenostylis stenocarpa]|uniref:Uncharacterized protein n=1 Tax=Sphenostylis stenocarpa TaxID=92480 RepID=A0AA86SLD2_9FABA|nr:unnamed protein product [Sphenostylis stenocarpa]